VIDSIGENKPKLIECLPEQLPVLRASYPAMRILPVPPSVSLDLIAKVAGRIEGMGRKKLETRSG
jgi:hypothetical protein